MDRFGIEEGIPGDVDGDGDIDQDDWTALSDQLGICLGDLDGNGVVNGIDMGILLTAWGVCMP